MVDDSPEQKPRRKAGPQAKAAAPQPMRKARGFLRAGELTTEALKSTGARRGFAEARLLTDWREVVGEALDSVCRPVKVTYGARNIGLGATLVVTAEGARAPEVEMQRERILSRVNAFYGYRAVTRLRIDQSRNAGAHERAAGMGEAAAAFEGPPADRSGPVGEIRDDALADALARLGANIRNKAARDRAAGRKTDR